VEHARQRARPRYEFLRFDDDFSYLDGPEGSYQEDFFDPIKNIRLGDDLTLSLGGEIRFRLDSKRNEFLRPGPTSHDTFLLDRYALHLDARYRMLARVFVEGIHANVYDRDEFLFFIHRNEFDLHQLFADVRVLGEEVPLTLRIGRQEHAYGRQRVISPWGWGRIRQRFDAVKAFWRSDEWDLDLWYGQLVEVELTEMDWTDEDVEFYGAYATYKGIPDHSLDFYALGQHDAPTPPTNPNGRAGKRTSYTFGARFEGRTGDLDYELELNGQLGHWAGDDVRAWSLGTELGFTLDDALFRPRLAAGLEIASGDDDPTDSTVERFDQLWRQPKDFMGYAAIFGRQNIVAANVNLDAWLVPRKVRLELFHYWYWLESDRDGVFFPGGRPVPGRRDPAGQSGSELGTGFDVTLGWLVDAHQSVLLSYSRVFLGDFFGATGGGEDPEVFTVQYKILF
jgi:hypothetical protein